MMQKEEWLLWKDISRSPFLNMAIDELLQGEAARTGKVVLRFYGWDRPSVSFGYSQSPGALPPEAEGFVHVRRPTGGGIVFHDHDLTYTLAVPHEHSICALDRMMSYKVVHEAVMNAVKALGTVPYLAPETVEHDRATLQCFVSPSRHDIMKEGGAKLAGAAQRRGRTGLLHQGSISMDAAHGHSRENLIDALAGAFADYFHADYQDYAPSATFLQDAQKLADLKYASALWNNDRILPEEPEAAR